VRAAFASMSSAANHESNFCQYDSLDDAITATGATVAIGVIHCRLVVHSDQIVPATLSLYIYPGSGLLDLETSLVDLTINGPFFAQPTTVFVGAGMGNIIFSSTVVSPHWWSATGDGVTNDLAAIRDAYAASPVVVFQPGTYNLGTIATVSQTNLVTIDGGGGHAGLYTLGRVKFIADTTVSEIHNMFVVLNATSATIGEVEFEDTGFDISITWKGAAGINLYAADSSSPLRNIVVSSVRATNMVLPIYVTGFPATTNRVHNIHIGLIECTDCYYGWNAQNNGDDVVIDLIRTDNVYRSFFVYGCTGVRATVHSYNTRVSTGDVNVAAYASGYDTAAINVNYISRGADTSSYPISFVTIGTSRVTTISGVTIDADIDDTATPTLAHWFDHTASGGAENTGATNNVITDIILKGRLNSSAVSPVAFAAGAQPTTTGMPLSLEGDFLFGDPNTDGGAHSSIRPYFALVQDYGIYTPTWTASSANPALGDGSITGRFHRRGQLVTVSIDLAMGSTTTFGTGTWSFSLPTLLPSSIEGGNGVAVGVARLYDNGTNIRVGVVSIDTGKIIVEADSATGLTSPTVPFTWANGDRLTMQLAYYIAFP